jgi:hypothetical protein
MSIPSAYFARFTERRQRAIELMAARLSCIGQRVIIGTLEPLEIGCLVGRSCPIGNSEGRKLIVKRRATRAEFIEFAPAGAAIASAMATPFYWELGLVEEQSEK